MQPSYWHKSCCIQVSEVWYNMFNVSPVVLFLLQEDTSNITILGLLLECSLPKSLFNNPQVCLSIKSASVVSWQLINVVEALNGSFNMCMQSSWGRLWEKGRSACILCLYGTLLQHFKVVHTLQKWASLSYCSHNSHVVQAESQLV